MASFGLFALVVPKHLRLNALIGADFQKKVLGQEFQSHDQMISSPIQSLIKLSIMFNILSIPIVTLSECLFLQAVPAYKWDRLQWIRSIAISIRVYGFIF